MRGVSVGNFARRHGTPKGMRVSGHRGERTNAVSIGKKCAAELHETADQPELSYVAASE